MEQKASSPGYIRPLALNALLVVNIVLAMSFAIVQQRDGHLGGLGYFLYAGVSMLVSTGINLVAFIRSLRKYDTWAKVIYAVAALVFIVLSAIFLGGFGRLGDKIGG